MEVQKAFKFVNQERRHYLVDKAILFSFNGPVLSLDIIFGNHVSRIKKGESVNFAKVWKENLSRKGTDNISTKAVRDGTQSLTREIRQVDENIFTLPETKSMDCGYIKPKALTQWLNHTGSLDASEKMPPSSSRSPVDSYDVVVFSTCG